MTEDRFYICDPGRETHLVVMMLNSGEFENALEEIRFEKEMGSDAAEDHVFAALARYELGMHEDLVREGAKSLNQFEEQIRKENSPAQAVAAKADHGVEVFRGDSRQVVGPGHVLFTSLIGWGNASVHGKRRVYINGGNIIACPICSFCSTNPGRKS